ncbi:DUF2147 domain-containing protein [Aestuariivirga sp.]|uniref:DUF2147 domain-containing protein n=1 Tax=Aestuariivirga sp. TaxID=2650926 RepID=UPI003BA8971E
MLNTLKRTTLALAFLSLPLAGSAMAQGPEGTWTMSDGKVTVKVDQCGGNLCARIVALKEPISKIDGKPKVDRENPDPAKRKRPLIGLSILIGMKPAGENLWQGAIYNPDDGNTYSATVKNSGSQMKVKGCVASVFCKTNTFVRKD